MRTLRLVESAAFLLPSPQCLKIFQKKNPRVRRIGLTKDRARRTNMGTRKMLQCKLQDQEFCSALAVASIINRTSATLETACQWIRCYFRTAIYLKHVRTKHQISKKDTTTPFSSFSSSPPIALPLYLPKNTITSAMHIDPPPKTPSLYFLKISHTFLAIRFRNSKHDGQTLLVVMTELWIVQLGRERQRRSSVAP